MTTYGYARVSTRGQELEIQLEKLKEVGINEANIYSEKFTGGTLKRPKFTSLIKKLKPFDILVVTRLERLARNTREALNIIEPLMNDNVTVKVLNIGTIENTPIGRFFLRTLLSVAEMERDMIIDRIREGKENARKNPEFKEGRPKRTITAEYRRAYDLLENLTAKEVAEQMCLSLSTVYRIKKQVEGGRLGR